MPELQEINGKIKSTDVKVVQLKRSIGLVSSITIIIGSMIGSGIFVSPTGILENVQSVGASLIIWVLCGIYSMLGAYSYAELGTIIQRSGGDYIYVYEAFGPFFGFLRLWVEVIVARPASIAIMAMTFGKYVVQPFFPTCQQPEFLIRILAIICILLLSFANALSVKLSTRIQDIFTLAKLLALLMIIITGIVRICMGHHEALVDSFAESDWSPGALTKAFYAGLFAYAGWNYLNCMIEEMSNPRRHLPAAIVISCLSVTFIYTAVNIAYVTVVSPHEILTTPAVAVTFASRVYGVMWWIMPIFVACSTFGGVNGTIMTTSRIFYVASQLEQMPNVLCFLHVSRLTPIIAVIFTCLISTIYLFVGDIYALMTYLGFVQWLAIGLCVSVVILFRITRKNEFRPVKVPIIFAFIYVIVTLLLVIVTFVAAPTESIFGVLIILTGIPVYLFGCLWKNKPKSFRQKVYSFTVWIQKLLHVVPSN